MPKFYHWGRSVCFPGAFGFFEVTHDITKYCKAKIFDTIGKKTPLVVRCSTVGQYHGKTLDARVRISGVICHWFEFFYFPSIGGERGSADTARDPRGFAVKFYTEEGNWDLVGNNTPIFFIRDPMLVRQLQNVSWTLLSYSYNILMSFSSPALSIPRRETQEPTSRWLPMQQS